MDSVTLRLPGDTQLPVPTHAWERVGGHIIATYTVEELAWALVVVDHPAGHKRLTELKRRRRLSVEAKQLRFG